LVSVFGSVSCLVFSRRVAGKAAINKAIIKMSGTARNILATAPKWSSIPIKTAMKNHCRAVARRDVTTRGG
jgi:hypothetical protein